MEKPVIAITMGDAAGIGPELVVKVLSERSVWETCSPFIVGDPAVMKDICDTVGADLRFKAIGRLSEAGFSLPEVDVLCPEGVHIGGVPWGRVDPAMGRAAALCLQEAFALARDGQVQGVVSAPLNKEAFHLAGYPYTDDLAYLADLTRSQGTFILGVISDVAGSIWTVAVTEHVPFRDIVDLVKKDRILWAIGRMHDVLTRVGFADPRIAVAALNVHAGEGALFGREEIDEIGPAIVAARGQGIDAEGPVPADMIFVRALAGDFDGVVCMYHDQATIARKLQPKEKGATLYMGLPVICGTTAHGTAFDIAGKGIADPGSLGAALKYTVQLCS
jgi:4-hydroxy-L-threonine phosphate dehydrogenase PdxA